MNRSFDTYFKVAENLTDSQLQQLCHYGRSMGYISKGFSLEQARMNLVLAAVVIYMHIDLTHDRVKENDN